LSQEQKFWDKYSITIFAILFVGFIFYLVKIYDLTQDVYVRSIDDYQADIIERIRPVGQVYRSEQEKEASMMVEEELPTQEPILTAMSNESVSANECSLEVTTGDNLAYSVSEISLPSNCEEVAVTFKHLGSLPAAVMGHNLVIAKTSDLQPIQDDANKAGMAGGWLMADDARVIVSSKIIGGGESTELIIKSSSLSSSEQYSFFCTVMSHSAVMRGPIS